jgi:predicted peptidase
MKYLIVILLFTSCKQTPETVKEVQIVSEYQSKSYQSSTLQLPFRLLSPNKITEDTPIVLFLHGAGERGEDNEIQLVHGGQMFLDSIEKYPALYVFPQCPKDGYWSNVEVDRSTNPVELNFDSLPTPTPAMQAVLELLDMLVDEYKLKSTNHKVLGLSMGGMGTFEILQYRPDFFNKSIAICGGGHLSWADKYSKTSSIWIAHGMDDNVVALGESISMYEAISSNELEVKFDQYPEVGHNSWDNVFADPDMLQWLFDN